MRGGACCSANAEGASLMARVGRYGIPRFVWSLIWLVVCILIVILLALVIHHFGGASLSLKLGHFYLNIGVT
ncbi:MULTISPECIES: hypothetical protein [unclassified Micromonospora]|uniref:hypothetical protein n=1 Tax=Micromonospora TaxID=1873 RepID=UPI00188E4771|nr:MULTISPECIES: hypothetical protein [unclassified Micromonospora]MBF5030755.1 hypothetical protein [Micromonospora sp. ANENR4]MCZ7474117.1 hypothetical protein [Micromonospora sp. WMMC273]WBC04769.1 hypothetical protein O7546_07350 [Micromonospora sp. WMMA1976]WBC09454.1 hypothetical protein O7604_00750 [Micromonospora sp. WMMA1947]